MSSHSAELAHTFRIRWSAPAEIVVTVTVAADELDVDDLTSVEEYAYDVAVELARQRLDEIGCTVNGVSVHAEIDGCEADEVEELHHV